MLRSISIAQTHQLPLMEAGLAVPLDERPVPLVAGKRALVRAFVELEPGFEARPMLGVLDLVSERGADTLLSDRRVASSSTQDDLSSTFIFDVEARDLETTTSYRLRVLEADTTPVARFPEGGFAPLSARQVNPFELVLVPLVSQGHAPKTDEAELSALRSRLLALFPTTKVVLSVTAPISIGYAVDGNGQGWDDALDLIYELRAQADPAPQVFYYGMLAPDTSYGSYCSQGCTVGYSVVAAEDEVSYRGSIGVTVFEDGSGKKDAWDTLAHELGHALGREHAPCGIEDPTDIDPGYPYPNALLGIYGFDFERMKLIKPGPSRDVMSYCTPVWISDYTYRGIFERLEAIRSESFRALAWSSPESFRVARVGRAGHSSWRSEQRSRSTSGMRQQLQLLDANGRAVGSISARWFRLDHAAGGYAWISARELAQSSAAAVDLSPLGGVPLSL